MEDSSLFDELGDERPEYPLWSLVGYPAEPISLGDTYYPQTYTGASPKKDRLLILVRFCWLHSGPD